jgi:hypothetical protein
MAENGVALRAGPAGAWGPRVPIGAAFAYQASIWRVQGLYLTQTPSGGRELWWILDEQKPQANDASDGGGA